MNFPVDLLQALLACGIAFLGATIQGSIGIGLGLIGVPLLVLIDPVFIPGPLLLAALILTALIAHREHRSIDFKGIKWAISGRITGTVLGAFLLTSIPQNSLSLLFGIMVLLAVTICITGIHLPVTPRNLFGAGTFSGFMGTTSSIGGAPMALIYQRHEGPRLRGTLSGIFIIGTTISLVTLIIIKRFGLRELLVTSVLIPGGILGFILSRHTAKILDQGFIRPAVLIASAASGIIVIIKNFF